MSPKELSAGKYPTNPFDLAQGHLDILQDADFQMAEYFGECLSKDGPLATTVVIIPVAAHQESANIYHALSQYARQDTDRPFTVVLGMNAPAGLTDPDVQASYRELNRARADFPHLDVRDVFMHYLEAPIGTIRADLWNGVIAAGLRGGTITANQDIVGINHDIDLVKLPRHYIRSVQEYGSQPWRDIHAAYTRIRHAYHPDYPNVSRLLQWLDYAYQEIGSGYEAGAVIPLHTYITRGGINPSRSTYEVNSLLRGASLDLVINGGKLQTSPRRYIARLASHGLDKIWTDESFGNNDSYRTVLSGKDISEDQLDSLLADANKAYLQRMLLKNDAVARPGAPAPGNLLLADKSPLPQEMREEQLSTLRQRLRLKRNVASRIMRSCVARPAIADQIDAEYNDARLELFAQESLDTLARVS